MRTRTDKARVAVASLLAFSLAGAGCAEAKADKSASADSSAAAAVPMPTTDRMPMADFQKLYAKNDVVVVDVRNHEAYVGGHIPGALSIPEESITEATGENLRRMGKPIATYCS